MEQVATDPTPLANNITRLKGLRVGDLRVIYADGIVLAVVRIAPRGSAYE